MIFSRLAFVLTCVALLLPLPVMAATAAPSLLVQAQPLSAEQVLQRLFQAPQIPSGWFAESFLRQVPFAGIQPLIDELRQSLGPLQSVQPTPDGYELRFERGRVRSQIALNAQGQITTLFFAPPQIPIPLTEAAAAVQRLPGEVSLLVRRGDQDLVSLNADQPLAVGSAFKLAVLAALQTQINQGHLQWDQGVALQPAWKSLPSGLLQDWPDGTALTLETLATLMISLSDNTATDALIHILGRDSIEALGPRNQPFLTTREAFALKNPQNSDLLYQFRRGDTARRRALLEPLAEAPLPAASLFANRPLAPDIEWFFSAEELCDLLAQVGDLPLMQVNPGVAEPQDWDAIAFKGGSEPGVLNFTSQVQSAAGATYCVVLTWNNPEQSLDETALAQLYSGILAGLGAAP